MTQGLAPQSRNASRDGETAAQAYSRVRADSERICALLEIEDYGIQTMPDVSPPKWHLAHTSWFFEEFVLVPAMGEAARFDPAYAFLFNSYYDTVGARHEAQHRLGRGDRGGGAGGAVWRPDGGRGGRTGAPLR